MAQLLADGPGLLDGRTALVTGGATGIGRAIALGLASDGAQVAVNHLPDADSARGAAGVVTAIAAMGGRSVAVAADVSDENEVRAMIDTIRGELGRLDVVVANAAISVASNNFWRELTAADWAEVMAVNVTGAFLCVNAAYDDLKASGHGAVVVISSVTPLLGRTGNLHYVTSKAALIGFTRALAREAGPDGVRVNAIAPGAIKTPNEAIYGSDQELSAAIAAVQSLGRRGEPADVASVASFLVSDRASFMTGQLLVVDGGWVMH